MIRIELPTLIGKLNSQSKTALEEAASLCISRQNAEVTFLHLLCCLLDNPLGDVRLLLKSFELDADQIRQQALESMAKDTSLDTYPVFSPLLIELMQDAWLLSSTELGQTQLRSGALLVCSLIHAERYLPAALIDSFSAVNRESLRRNFTVLLRDSSESHKVEQTAAQTSPQPATALGKYTTDFTALARQQQLDPVLCRDDEISLMIDILCRRRKNNPIVVGDAGVGKSAVVEGLAQRIAQGMVPDKLKDVTLLSLDLGLLQAGASVKGEFEKRLKNIIDEVKQSPVPVVLFIDEAHTLIGAGNQEGGGDAANLLKPALARGELMTVAATTWKEYKKYVEKDPALSRRFQLVKLDEPSAAQTVNILRGLHSIYEQQHQVFIQDAALKAAAFLSDRYLSGRQLPDKAIDVLDTACARVAINMSTPPRRLSLIENLRHQYRMELGLIERQQGIGYDIDAERQQQLQQLLSGVDEEYQELSASWELQRNLSQQIIEIRRSLLENIHDDGANTEELRAELRRLESELTELSGPERLVFPQVDEAQIAAVIGDWTGVPVSQMTGNELDILTHLPQRLEQSLKGQSPALARLHRHLLTARADLRRAGRPKGAFLLVGPSGVGKTETVVQIAEQLYGGKQFMTTINMSEYQEKHTVSRLIGSPPGYVGYGEGGLLTEAIRKKPYSVVLLDEVEKAHPDVLNLFYQAFDKGELADGEGRLIDCQNVLFFLTSNLGFQTIVDHAHQVELLEEALYPELAAFFKPALLARMEIVPYLPLGEDVLKDIIVYKLGALKNRLIDKYKADVSIADALVEAIQSRATRSENGARMLEAIIDGQVLPPVSLALLNRLALKEPVSKICLDYRDGEFVGEVC
ncbi:type VI secretion system ATPase TssH [Shewanella khirikhana]|uniref:Chaperone protein ClpB n=1 Tax=Shewanella khirikhana TaxID=1965282 RepID=A0ABM7DNL1_9GAMM|nr:type VI secretion system ATPase TssH [Shewanella khirikhana]AZQ10872.1 Chaperone protein ClpB [Shewanella khirikhana]